jgi:putative ABC transport system permease protein
MRALDRLGFCLTALREHRLRSALSMLGIAIGVAAVMLLTSVGEGARSYVAAQFSQFGTNLLQVTPGRIETVGIPGVLGGSTRKLTLADAEALGRVPGVLGIVPTVVGQGAVEGGGRTRDVYVIATTSQAPGVWKMPVRRGSFLQGRDASRAGSEAVLGPKLAREMFGEESALGQWVRIAGARLRVVGVMESKGEMLAFDLDDVAYVDLATGMQLFNTDELSEIDVEFSPEVGSDLLVERVTRVLTERHGREDFTVLTQAAMLEAFDAVLRAVTLAVAAIGGVSLLVGAIGVLTILWIAVGERTHEIGLLRAIGAPRGEILRIFLVESALLAGLGGAAGLLLGAGSAALIGLLVPGLPIESSPQFAAAGLLLSIATGLVAGVAPARRAARLDPIESLRAE